MDHVRVRSDRGIGAPARGHSQGPVNKGFDKIIIRALTRVHKIPKYSACTAFVLGLGMVVLVDTLHSHSVLGRLGYVICSCSELKILERLAARVPDGSKYQLGGIIYQKSIPGANKYAQ